MVLNNIRSRKESLLQKLSSVLQEDLGFVLVFKPILNPESKHGGVRCLHSAHLTHPCYDCLDKKNYKNRKK